MTTFELSAEEAQIIEAMRAAKLHPAPEPPADPARHTWGMPGVQDAHEAAERTVAALGEHEKSLVRSDNELNDAERLAIYIIGCQALDYAFGREYLMGMDNGDGLGALWQVTTKAIYRALPSMGQGNLEAIADQVREGAIKVD